MPLNDIPDDIRAFLLGSIDFIGELEALMLLAGEPGRSWTQSDLAARLYVDVAQAQAIAEKLTALGFVFGSDGGFHFSPRSETMRDLAERVIAVYGQKLVPVTNLIHSKPDRLREFSDAFKLKRET